MLIKERKCLKTQRLQPGPSFTTCILFSFKVFIMENSKTYKSKKKVNSTHVYCCCLVAQSCLTLFDPTDCSPPGSSVHGFSRQEYWSRLPFPSPHKMHFEITSAQVSHLEERQISIQIYSFTNIDLENKV